MSVNNIDKLRQLFAVIALFISFYSEAQSDSCGIRMTLLTCAPGAELYSTFGHTAIRVQDSRLGIDEVYNYGTFEFSPDFNSKFIRGKLLYSLSVEEFRNFLFTYQMESRTVVEQELQLNCSEKNRLYRALRVNALEENRFYRYDFLFDNCTTRAGDIISRNTDSGVRFSNILPAKHPTFRNLIHEYLDAGHQPWSKLGIDLLLGVRLDRKVSNHEAMFLPDYLLRGFDHATTSGHRLVSPAATVLAMPSPLTGKPLVTPFLAFLALLVLVLAAGFSNRRWVRKALNVFDFLFFFILGLAGILLLFMWFGTDHRVCAWNFNLLWALPTHAVMAFLVPARKKGAQNYFRAVSYLMLGLILAWFFLPQNLNEALLPLVALAGLRSWKLSKRTDDERTGIAIQ